MKMDRELKRHLGNISIEPLPNKRRTAMIFLSAMGMLSDTAFAGNEWGQDSSVGKTLESAIYGYVDRGFDSHCRRFSGMGFKRGLGSPRQNEWRPQLVVKITLPLLEIRLALLVKSSRILDG